MRFILYALFMTRARERPSFAVCSAIGQNNTCDGKADLLAKKNVTCYMYPQNSHEDYRLSPKEQMFGTVLAHS